MTYKGIEINGKPTLAMIQDFVARKNLYSQAGEIYFYWEKKNWKTKQGYEVKTLEAACDVYNGIAVSHARKNHTYTKKSKKSEKAKLHDKNIKQDALIYETETKKTATEKKEKEILSYNEQLKDRRWKAFREFVMIVRGNRCEKCGGRDFLQIHHIQYKKGCLAWEYNCNEVMVLCGNCHQKIHKLK